MTQQEIAKRELWEKILSPSSILLHGYFLIGILLFFIWGLGTIKKEKQNPKIIEMLKKPYRKYLFIGSIYIQYLGLWPVYVYEHIRDRKKGNKNESNENI